MSGELLINVTPSETRVALIENGVLQEVHVERESRRGLVGNIYLGKVIRVLPGMQAAFIDINLDKAAFLHASDINTKLIINNDDLPADHVPDIRALVHEGQQIVVQVIKDPLGTKGARLTTDITVAARYLVLMPNANHAGISQRIEHAKERNRLKDIITPYCSEEHGFIVRTAAEGADEKELKHDAEFLRRVWKKVQDRKKRKQFKTPIYQDLSLAFRVLRDFVGIDFERIRIDSKLTYEQLREFTEEFVPNLTPVLECYPGERPIFDLFDVENEIQRALHRRIDLKSGGYLIIDQTEAMTTIDINTGGFVGHRNLEETIFNTNLEATQVIARQLRLRNLGGIIIVDFIDMNSVEHQKRVLHSLDVAMAKDKVKYSISKFSKLGLVEMTRKRTRESLEHVLCGECSVCSGRGHLKTVETVCFEILREIVRVNRAYDSDKFIVYASSAVSESLINDEYHHLAELEVFIGKQIKVQTESMYNQEQFDVIMM
ncbi:MULTISPECIES: ribonuclease G [unclassified Colwellia]|jgi:ribonuclease G|uniref:ribonuclease G n=1 Tax=unclassified Colwellia TaxID=196834 RepID=UPI0015F50271|nr:MULTISPECIES: ribonuclease G [unclassified Colwellia]MBA6232085.1 ribonuclease G [Colwellia sp. MB02u-7]MBA6237217.1 ribonuclease G [Colwellia sp. MB02u-11]MBA6254695.1 ribonuclease G [Colwellia sp. MB3u-28]MBA6260423.1 ribonuclease G [Colwellia sp. MB3u-41]MBA6300216.1 ribonuclease G [Colwellia sp. MB3u-22]